MSKSSKNAPEAMDPTVTETATPVVSANRQRTAYALATLIDEVMELFPETVYEVSAYDGRNVGLDVQFHSEDDFGELSPILRAVVVDERVNEVLVDEEDQYVLVSLHANARTQDSRAPFGLVDVLTVLAEDNEEGASW